MDDATLRRILWAQHSAMIALQKQIVQLERSTLSVQEPEAMRENFEEVLAQLSVVRDALLDKPE